MQFFARFHIHRFRHDITVDDGDKYLEVYVCRCDEMKIEEIVKYK